MLEGTQSELGIEVHFFDLHFLWDGQKQELRTQAEAIGWLFSQA